jgi:DNA-binding beta-propeller fold protein YncE
MKRLGKILLALGAMIMVVLVAVKLIYGGGERYDDVSTAPAVPADKLETLVALDFPPGNVAVSADNRILFAYHPFAKTERFSKATLFELVDGKPVPFPNADAQSKLQGVFGMTVDGQNRLWAIESAGLDFDHSRLLGFDLKTNQQFFSYEFPEGETPFAQDLRVSPDGKTIYLADTGLFQFTKPGLTVFDIASKSYRTVLKDHASVLPQKWVTQTPFGPHKLGYGLVSFQVGLDGIVLSADGNWLYFGAMNHDTLYKIPTAALLDPTLSKATLEKQIVKVGKKPLSDGIARDPAGNILITDIEHGGIARMTPDGKLQTLLKSPRVIWADGVVMAPDGSVIFTDSAIPAYIDQFARPPALEKFKAKRPFHIYRFPLPIG